MTATFDRSLLFYFSKDMELAKIEPPFVVRDGTIALEEPLVIVTSLLGSFGIYPQDVPLIEDEVTYFYARVDTKHEETKLEVSDKIIEKTTDGDIQYLLIGYVNPVLDNEMQEIEYTYIEDASVGNADIHDNELFSLVGNEQILIGHKDFATSETIKNWLGSQIEVIEHPNKIVNGYWFIWNNDVQDYVDTGLRASGDCQYTTFSIDLDTGLLIAKFDPNFVNTEFELINGMLVVKIN